MTTSLSNYCTHSNIQYNPYPLWLAIVYLWCYHAAIHKQRHHSTRYISYLKFAMHQVSVLSPLLFVVVMDVVPSEARSGIPSELQYADDLVLIAPIMEPLGRRVTE